MLMDVLPALERVNNNATTLQALQSSTDRRLGAGLYEQFLSTLLEAIESDVAKAKMALSKVQSLLRDLDEARARISRASRTESARFAEIDSEGVDSLVSGLLKDTVESLTSDPSLNDVETRLGVFEQGASTVEEALARLDDAFCELKRLILERPSWK
jgi:hypothetical protein